jgi:glucokinase
MADESSLLGVDVGGTSMSAGIVTRDGRVLAEERTPTHRDGPGSAVETIAGLIKRMLAVAHDKGASVAGIGVGVPGPVNTVTGRIGAHVPHVPELASQPLAAMLAERFGLPAFVDNDCNALALGEWTFGAGRGSPSMVLLAPGTGFGAGIIIDGRLVRGAAGFGGELGHTPVKFDGPPCWCGGRGCLALYASGRGITDAARARASEELLAMAGGDAAGITTALVFRAAAARERVAAAIVADAVQALGAMVATVVNALNPDVIVLTGGVVASFAALESGLMAATREYAFADGLAATRIVITPGDKSVTMRGAAALVAYETTRRPTAPSSA